MRQRCEVCESFRPDADLRKSEKLVEVPLDVRPVLLCTGHALIAQNSGVQSFAGLRELYGRGRRSFVPRRRPSVTGQANEKRATRGRRTTDA